MLDHNDPRVIENGKQLQKHIEKHNYEGALIGLTLERIKELGLK